MTTAPTPDLREQLSSAASYDALGVELAVSVDSAVELFADWLRAFADFIDRGPTFPLPPSVFSALVRERADDLDDVVREASRG